MDREEDVRALDTTHSMSRARNEVLTTSITLDALHAIFLNRNTVSPVL